MSNKSITDLANEYNISIDAALILMHSIQYYRATIARFDHPELGGIGSWQRGDISTQHGDVDTRTKIDSICSELTDIMKNQSVMDNNIPKEKEFELHSSNVPAGWWPDNLGEVTASGMQFGMEFVYSNPGKMLAICFDDEVTAYDTSGYEIGGITLLETDDYWTASLTTQHGMVSVKTLDVMQPV